MKTFLVIEIYRKLNTVTLKMAMTSEIQQRMKTLIQKMTKYRFLHQGKTKILNQNRILESQIGPISQEFHFREERTIDHCLHSM